MQTRQGFFRQESSSQTNEFVISNELAIREFSDGDIVRISVITIDGHPYTTYSKTNNGELISHGVIYIGGKFLKINFQKQELKPDTQDVQKKDNLLILSEFTKKLYTKEIAKIDVKIFDKTQNNLKNFNQNYGFIENVQIEIVVLDEQNEIFVTFSGVTDDKGEHHKGLNETRKII